MYLSKSKDMGDSPYPCPEEFIESHRILTEMLRMIDCNYRINFYDEEFIEEDGEIVCVSTMRLDYKENEDQNEIIFSVVADDISGLTVDFLAILLFKLVDSLDDEIKQSSTPGSADPE